MSLGVTRICRLRRLGPGVHVGSSSRGQSFRYHLLPKQGKLKKGVPLRSKEGSLFHDVPYPPSKASRLSGDSPLGGFEPVWYFLDLFKLPQKANPMYLTGILQSKLLSRLNAVSKQNSSSFLPTRTPAVVDTILSETKVRYPRHLHSGSHKYHEATPLFAMAALFLTSASKTPPQGNCLLFPQAQENGL